MKRNGILSILAVIIFIICMTAHIYADTVQDKIRREADYILACQYIEDPQSPAYGAINDITGDPTWVVPRENGMAILGLIIASEVLNDVLYINRAQLAADYLVSIQDQNDGAWCNHYNFTQVVDSAKSPTQTAEVMIGFAKLGYQHDRYTSVKKGAQYLMDCQAMGGDGLLCGGKESGGNYSTWRWASDNSYAYWALKAAESWAVIDNDISFALECVQSAQDIINGINTLLYNPITGVWHIVIDENGNSLGNPDLLPPYDNLPSWINYAPQMLDLPVYGINSPAVGQWIKDNFQQSDGSCIAYAWDNGLKTRKYPGYSFQSSLCWYDTNQSSYADSAITWAENSGLWQITPDPNGISGGWIDWIEISPDPGNAADWWFRFIDTSFYSIACWNGGYDFNTSYWLLNLPVPWYEEEQSFYSAAASCKMILDYIREETILTQDELYDYGHFHNHPDNAGINNIDPQGVKSTLNYYHPNGYNFSIRAMSNAADSMRDICHWMDYTVPGVSITNVPATFPAFGVYNDWMVIRGACASNDPSEANSFTIYGFWLNDPGVAGIGENSYKTAMEFQNTYFLPLNTQDIWNGKYVSVCEPPKALSRARVNIAKNYNIKSANKFLQTLSLVNRIKTFNWKELIDYYLLQDENFRNALDYAVPCSPIKVKRIDKVSNDYYIVPFNKMISGGSKTSAVLVIDALGGNFREASWVDIPVKYNLRTKNEAIKFLLNSTKQLKISNISKIEAELIWSPCKNSSSPYYPFWKIKIGAKTWLVYQNGVIECLNTSISNR